MPGSARQASSASIIAAHMAVVSAFSAAGRFSVSRPIRTLGANDDFGLGAHQRNISRAMITRMISLVPSRIWWTRRSRTIRSSG